MHLVNALMYILAWWQYGFPLLHFIHLPELLNVTGTRSLSMRTPFFVTICHLLKGSFTRTIIILPPLSSMHTLSAAAVLYISSSFYYSKEQTTSDDYGGPPYNDFYTGQVCARACAR